MLVLALASTLFIRLPEYVPADGVVTLPSTPNDDVLEIEAQGRQALLAKVVVFLPLTADQLRTSHLEIRLTDPPMGADPLPYTIVADPLAWLAAATPDEPLLRAWRQAQDTDAPCTPVTVLLANDPRLSPGSKVRVSLKRLGEPLLIRIFSSSRAVRGVSAG
ncbi:MAG: hypothetical protein R3D98_05245 [Candidatus Krumholzibacteriia bacterium]